MTISHLPLFSLFALVRLQIYWPPLPGNREDCIQMGKEPQARNCFVFPYLLVKNVRTGGKCKRRRRSGPTVWEWSAPALNIQPQQTQPLRRNALRAPRALGFSLHADSAFCVLACSRLVAFCSAWKRKLSRLRCKADGKNFRRRQSKHLQVLAFTRARTEAVG